MFRLLQYGNYLTVVYILCFNFNEEKIKEESLMGYVSSFTSLWVLSAKVTASSRLFDVASPAVGNLRLQ